MKLVIYETTHHETLPAMLDLSEIYFEKIAVFLKETTYLNLCDDVKPEQQWPRTTFFRQTADYPNRSFINNTILFFKQNNCTHLHISTLDNNLLYFAWRLQSLRKARISLSVQAINEYRVYRYNNLRDITESVAKLFFHRRILNYRVFFPLMEDLLERSISGTKAVFIPSRFFSGRPVNLLEPADSFKIVIPGSVDPNRRDYDFVFEFFRTHISSLSNQHSIELIILGKCDTEYGKKFIKKLVALTADNLRLTYYSDYVSQSLYQKKLAEADIIWSPIRIETVGIRGTAEVYGLSTATGLTADLLFNCKPALVPDGFTVPEHYHEAFITYKSPDELAGIIIKFMNGDYKDISAKIYESFSFFSKEKFLKQFEILMEINSVNRVTE